LEVAARSGISIRYDAEERDTADLIGSACEKTVDIVRAAWGLGAPKDCRVYAMTSWFRFLRLSAPWYWWLFAGPTMPLWVSRVRKIWKIAGGWTQRYGSRWAIGVKPPRIIEQSDRSLGKRIFVQEDDLRVKVEHITCHELVHACSGHLRLPAWLNEGLAMVAVDKYMEQPTVQPETIASLRDGRRRRGAGRKRALPVGDNDALVYSYVRGYWLTRYLDDTEPELLRELLSRRRGRKALEADLAAAFGMARDRFWDEIDGMVASHFA
jgi:hypothetical protein